MEVQANRNKIVSCTICGKRMRSDTLKRHIRIHKDILSMTDEEVRVELRERHAESLRREERRKKVLEIALEENIPSSDCNEVALFSYDTTNSVSLRENMNYNNQEYIAKIELGEQIATIMIDDNIREQSLSKEHKEALKFYRNQMTRTNIQDVELRPWQQHLFEIIKIPSEREVIWIIGKDGNEGKSWFQDYVESCFGFNRVARLDLRIKHKDSCNILKKRPLSSIDTFLFNDGRSIPPDEHTYYRILENIKDGFATSSKYDNDIIKFKRPNTVIVFSNIMPDWGKLSMDRWKSYRIESNQLVIHGDMDKI